jgi:hypothetical protein
VSCQQFPCYLTSRARSDDALANLAYLRRLPTHDAVIHELAEIKSVIAEERAARAGLGWKEAFFGKGNFMCLPLLGEYSDCFTAEQFVVWVNNNVQGFGGSLDCVEAAH